MDWWKQQVGACFDSVAVAMPQLQSSLSQLGHSMGEWVGSLGVGASSGGGGADALGQEYELGSRRLRVVRQLGEGGYSFVYLAKEVQQGGPGGQPGLLTPPAGAGGVFALKRVLCGSEDQLAEAKREVATMRRLRHPCLLPLLDAAVTQQRAPDGSPRAVVLMLFPVFDQGNLFDFVQQQRQQWEREPTAAAAPGQRGGRAAARVQHLRDSLHVFLQVCAALHSMHSMDPPLAHRDLKPHNVLLRLRQAPPDEGAAQQQPQRRDEGQQQEQQGQQAAERAWQPQWGGGGAAEVPVHEEGAQPDPRQQQQQQQQGGVADATQEWWGRRLAVWRQRYEAVLMDFGSTRPAPLHVRNRAEAMAAQEDAERMCTAPYRSPELWDVPSSCTIDERVDVWSLGCLLYFLICGQSPFERTAGEAGGSLLLAVTSGRVAWPDDAACSCPAALRQLVEMCLDTDPAGRPAVAEVAVKADAALSSLPT